MYHISLILLFSWFSVLEANKPLVLNSLKNEESTIAEYSSDVSRLLFNKYSNYSSTLSLESLQSLLNCSNGNSGCTQDSPSFVKSLFESQSICRNESKIYCQPFLQCTSAEDLSSIFSVNADRDGGGLTFEEFDLLSPILLYQAQAQLCTSFHDSLNSTTADKKPTYTEVWGYGILFVTLISACSLVGVSVLPVMAREFYQKLLTALIGLAVGSLASSAAFHLIPQAFKIGVDADGTHGYLFVSLAILCGIWGFFMIESIIKIVLGVQTHRRGGNPLQNSSSDQAFVGDGKYARAPSVPCNCQSRDASYHSHDSQNLQSLSQSESHQPLSHSRDKNSDDSPTFDSCHMNDVELIYNSQKQAMKASFGHVQERPEKDHSMEIHFHQGEDSVIATVAWMIIFGDGFHNFIDGVSIGAAFQQSILTGISISLAVMCEELPHELGDFAVLLNSGMAMKQALFYNFLSATTCYLGMVIGILLGEFTQNSSYIFALAGGMFLYISLADMIPEMNETLRKAANEGPREAAKVLLLQNIGIFIGVVSLFALAFYQDKLTLE